MTLAEVLVYMNDSVPHQKNSTKPWLANKMAA